MMKVLILFSLILLPLHGFSQASGPGDYQVYQVDPDSDIEVLKAPKHRLENIPKNRVITAQEVDYFVDKYLGEKGEKMGRLEKDLFVRRAIHYPEKAFLKKYKNLISKAQLTELRKDLGGRQ